MESKRRRVIKRNLSGGTISDWFDIGSAGKLPFTQVHFFQVETQYETIWVKNFRPINYLAHEGASYIMN